MAKPEASPPAAKTKVPSPKSDGAFGHPGIEPRWTHGGKDGVGTTYSADSHVWFTFWNGIITECYYPTVDRPQIRDLQYLITDGKTFFHEEKRDLKSKIELLSERCLGYRCTNTDPDGRYAIVKEVISAPGLSCILQHTRLTGDDAFLSTLKLYALCAPHLEIGGANNNGYVAVADGRTILMAQKNKTWLALTASIPFSRVSCGYVGRSDGWTDLHEDFQMDWEFEHAYDGNIALTGELDHRDHREFTLGLAFGDSQHHAITTLFQALGIPFKDHAKRYVEEWQDASAKILPLAEFSGDKGLAYHCSFNLLRAQGDKSYRGAFIASLSIPWGEAKSDEDTGGYHLVWTRDMVSTASAMLAAGDTIAPLRALIFLACSQQQDGGFAQNFWVDGTPHWHGIQLDEVAFPILLAWQLDRMKMLQDFDPYSLVKRAATYLVNHGPVTGQERWEEASGYSPSTLAACIAAMIGAASFARSRSDEATATFLEEYADFLESHLEDWTVTTDGSLVPGIKRYYIRIQPEDTSNPSPVNDPNSKILKIVNHAPGVKNSFPANNVVDAGFLQLVRYGIRAPDDPLIVDSLKVIDATLKVDTPYGPVWHRYNHDGYGQQQDGGPYIGWGVGGGWPLLTGERAHYELAAGHDVNPFIQAMEHLASDTGLLTEQVWCLPDNPGAYMFLGKPTGSAMPLMWTHSEYVKLLRSARDGSVFDLIPEVASRYTGKHKTRPALEIWMRNRQVRTIKRNHTLRILVAEPFRLHWSVNEWQSAQDTPSDKEALGIHYIDIPITDKPLRFTFFLTKQNRWEGHDYLVTPE